MKIEWAIRTDIRELRRYIAQDSPHYARRFVDRIFQAVEKLPEHPRLGRKVPKAARVLTSRAVKKSKERNTSNSASFRKASVLGRIEVHARECVPGKFESLLSGSMSFVAREILFQKVLTHALV